MNEHLRKLIKTGALNTNEELQTFLCFSDEIENPLILGDEPSTIRIYLPAGIVEVQANYNPDYNKVLETRMQYSIETTAYMTFLKKDGCTVSSFSDLQRDFIEIQLSNYKIDLFKGYKMRISDLDNMCCNKESWDAGMTYKDFLLEGRIVLNSYPCNDCYSVIYANFNTPASIPKYENWEDYGDIEVVIDELDVEYV